MSTTEVTGFGERVADVLASALDTELIGAYFVGSVALGGYTSGVSDLDIAAVCESPLSAAQQRRVASAVLEASSGCPARGLELVVYRRDVVGSPDGSGFELNVNAGPRMPTLVQLTSSNQPGFWFVIDRAVAHRSGITITGPPASSVFAGVPRRTVLEAMHASTTWHRDHEEASPNAVLNACRAWRYAEDDVLGSKVAGAAWARDHWPDTDVIDTAVSLRDGADAHVDATAVDAIMSFVRAHLHLRAHGCRPAGRRTTSRR